MLERSEVISKTAIDSGYVSNKIYTFPANLPTSGQSVLNLKINTSEPMQNVHFAYKRYDEVEYSAPIPMQNNASDIMQWNGFFTVQNQTTSLDSFNIRFYGQDLANNNILNIYKKTNKNDPSKSAIIPVRKGNGPQDWKHHSLADSGFDQIDFAIRSCGGRSSSTDYCALLSNLQVTEEAQSCHFSIIKVKGLENNYDDFTITWTVEHGQIISEYEHTDEIEVYPGLYCYRIEALHSCCYAEGCIEVHKGNLNQFVEITTQVERHACGGDNGRALIT